jgi:hypothetical protein
MDDLVYNPAPEVIDEEGYKEAPDLSADFRSGFGPSKFSDDEEEDEEGETSRRPRFMVRIKEKTVRISTPLATVGVSNALSCVQEDAPAALPVLTSLAGALVLLPHAVYF